MKNIIYSIDDYVVNSFYSTNMFRVFVAMLTVTLITVGLILGIILGLSFMLYVVFFSSYTATAVILAVALVCSYKVSRDNRKM